MSEKSKEFRCSASTINLFIKDPALFILKHYYGMTSEMGIYAIRGQAVEHGVNEFYKNGNNLDKAVNSALEFYYDKTFDLDDDTLAIEEMLPRWVKKALDALSRDNAVPKLQSELTFDIKGLPFIGYIDYSFDNHNIDLKTTNKVPSVLTRGDRKGKLPADKRDNVRQQCIYKYATGATTSLLYVSDQDSLLYTIQDDEYGEMMQEVADTVQKIQDLLTNGQEYGIKKYVPNEKLFNSFYWNDAMKRKAKEIWDL